MEVTETVNLRDYFASHAPPMPAEIRKNILRDLGEKAGGHVDPYAWMGIHAEVLANWNYAYADAMLQAGKE